MQLKVTPRLEERINARWLIWHPWVLILARKRLPFVATERTLSQCRELHRERYLEVLRYKINKNAIVRYGLDDPRMHMDEFRRKLSEAIARRTALLGKAKGVKRVYKGTTREIVG